MSMVPSKRLGSVGFFTPIYPIHKFITHLTIYQLPTSKYQRTIISRGCKNYVGSSNPFIPNHFNKWLVFHQIPGIFRVFLKGFPSFSEVKISRFFGGQNLFGSERDIHLVCWFSANSHNAPNLWIICLAWKVKNSYIESRENGWV